ncbi:MAG: LytR C-terminal domain-containing protein [Actinomycetota bacterium]
MGRHSSPRQWRYYTSILKYALPWILVALVGVSAVWAGVGALGDDELDTSKGPAVTRDEAPKRKSKPEVEPTPVEPEDEEADDKEARAPAEDEIPLITEGMTIQVLNGTNVAGVDEVMAERLQRLGYQVVNTAPAAITYAETTVLWSYAESEEAAARLAQRFGWQVKPKPDNLSTQVALHIVVGSDET